MLAPHGSHRQPARSIFNECAIYVGLWLCAYAAACADQVAVVSRIAGLNPAVLLVCHDRPPQSPIGAILGWWLYAALLSLAAQTVFDNFLANRRHAVLRALNLASPYLIAASVLLLSAALSGLDACLRITPPLHPGGLVVNPFASALACIIAGEAAAHMRGTTTPQDANSSASSARRLFAGLFRNGRLVPAILAFLALLPLLTPGPCLRGRWHGAGAVQSDWTEITFRSDGAGDVTEYRNGVMTAWTMTWQEDRDGISIRNGGTGIASRRFSGQLSSSGDQLRLRCSGADEPVLLLHRANDYA